MGSPCTESVIVYVQVIAPDPEAPESELSLAPVDPLDKWLAIDSSHTACATCSAVGPLPPPPSLDTRVAFMVLEKSTPESIALTSALVPIAEMVDEPPPSTFPSTSPTTEPPTLPVTLATVPMLLPTAAGLAGRLSVLALTADSWAFRFVPTMYPASPFAYSPGSAVDHGSPLDPAAFSAAPVFPAPKCPDICSSHTACATVSAEGAEAELSSRPVDPAAT